LVGPGRRLEDNKMDIKGKDVEWIQLAQFSVQWRVVVNTEMCFRIT